MAIYEAADKQGTSYDLCHNILTDDFGTRHVLGMFGT